MWWLVGLGVVLGVVAGWILRSSLKESDRRVLDELYTRKVKLAEGDREAVIALGPSAPREFEETIASGEKLAAVVAERRGGILAIEDGLPDVRQVREGRAAAGRGWIGITPRDAYRTADVRVTPLLPAWAALLLAGLLVIGAWLREGRR